MKSLILQNNKNDLIKLLYICQTSASKIIDSQIILVIHDPSPALCCVILTQDHFSLVRLGVLLLAGRSVIMNKYRPNLVLVKIVVNNYLLEDAQYTLL